MKIIVLGGFLGSGKTTLLLQLIDYVKGRFSRDVPVAVLENEVGSIDVDSQLVSGHGYAVTSMLSGCACCTLSGDLPVAIERIREDFDPEVLVVEATGLAVPGDMRDNIKKALDVDSRVCAIVDASRWMRMLVPMKTLLSQQLRDADVVVVNKVDLVSEGELAHVYETLDDFNRDASRFAVSAHLPLGKQILHQIVGG